MIGHLRPLFACLALLGALLIPRPASALPWWVEDDEAAEDLDAVLDSLWPGSPIVVVVGEPVFSREGVAFDGYELVLVSGDRVRFARSEPNWATLVSLVRGWLREFAVEDRGWLPPEAESVRAGPYLVAGGGAAIRLPTISASFQQGPASPSGHGALGGGWAWRHARIGVRTSFALGERAGTGSGTVVVNRFFIGATAGLVGTVGRVSIENELGFGARIAALRPRSEEVESATLAIPSFLLGLRAVGPVARGVRLGGGLGVGIDTAPILVRIADDPSPVLLSPVRVFVEIVVFVGGTREIPDPLAPRGFERRLQENP